MKIFSASISIIFAIFSLSSLGFAANEKEITLTTYYPAPYGDYTDLYVANAAGIGTPQPQAPLHVVGNAGAVNIEGTDHTYIQWYPDGYAAGRKAWTGFWPATSDDFNIRSDVAGADVVIQPGSGGSLKLGGSSPTYSITNVKTPIGSDPDSTVATKGYVTSLATGTLECTTLYVTAASGNTGNDACQALSPAGKWFCTGTQHGSCEQGVAGSPDWFRCCRIQ